MATMIEKALEGLGEFAGMTDKVDELYERRARAIRAAYDAGASVTGIARTLGVARQIVYDAIRKED